MKIIDKNGKLFGKISILDIIIVAVVLFLGVVAAMNLTKKTDLPVSVSSELQYTTVIKAYNLYKPSKSPFEVGDNLYSQSGEVIGKIVNVDAKPGYTKEKLQDGTYIDFENEDYTDYYLTVEGTGTYTDKGYKAQGSFLLCPNETINVASKLFYGNVVVLSVEKNN